MKLWLVRTDFNRTIIKKILFSINTWNIITKIKISSDLSHA